MPRLSALILATAAVAGLVSPLAEADQVSLAPVADSTIYSEDFAVAANGSGQYLFSGKVIRSDYVRRALLRFDLSVIPAGSTITAAELRLNMSRTIAGPLSFSLHRVTASWGEGTSNPEGQEGAGTEPTASDATWFFRFWETTNWTMPGGDFVPVSSASATVDQDGPYSWTSSGMVSDLQGWLAAASSNHGWILVGPEAEHSAKRFDSRESPVPSNRPVLVVTFTPPVTLCAGDANGDVQVTFADITSVLGNFGANYLPALDGPGDANHDGVVNFADVTSVLANFGSGCA